MPLSRQALRRSPGRSLLEFAKFPKEPPLRLISVPIIYRGNLLYIIQVGTSMDSVEETLEPPCWCLQACPSRWPCRSPAAGSWPAEPSVRSMRSRLLPNALPEAISLNDWTVPASADEIGRLTITFNDMIDRLETSFRQIRQFSSDASHELRTPLTVMKVETELALRRPRETDDYIKSSWRAISKKSTG